MDGPFGFGEQLVQAIAARFDLPVDVHLMVGAPASWAVRFARHGARGVAFHAEAVSARSFPGHHDPQIAR